MAHLLLYIQLTCRRTRRVGSQPGVLINVGCESLIGELELRDAMGDGTRTDRPADCWSFFRGAWKRPNEKHSWQQPQLITTFREDSRTLQPRTLDVPPSRHGFHSTMSLFHRRSASLAHPPIHRAGSTFIEHLRSKFTWPVSVSADCLCLLADGGDQPTRTGLPSQVGVFSAASASAADYLRSAPRRQESHQLPRSCCLETKRSKT